MECTEPISLEAKTSSNTALAVGEGVGYVDRVGAWDIEGAFVGKFVVVGALVVGILDMEGSPEGIDETVGNALG